MDPLVRRKIRRTNVEVTQLGFGGAGLGDLSVVVEDADATAALQAAWDAGIRYYDTCPWYGRGQSEHRFGRALYRRGAALLFDRAGASIAGSGANAKLLPLGRI
jgi:D-threo-aldose 1-dehydrogenase